MLPLIRKHPTHITSTHIELDTHLRQVCVYVRSDLRTLTSTSTPTPTYTHAYTVKTRTHTYTHTQRHTHTHRHTHTKTDTSRPVPISLLADYSDTTCSR